MANVESRPQNSPEFAQWMLDSFGIDMAKDHIMQIVITINYHDIPMMHVTRMVLDKEQIIRMPLQLKADND